MRSSNQRIQNIAKNINAMDMTYYYSNDMKVYRFWNNLYNKLSKILSELIEEDKKRLVELCKEENAKYFHLA